MDSKMINRPWGGYIILKKTENFWLKKLIIKPKCRTSLQSHKLRDEVWIVMNGEIKVQIGDKELNLNEGDILHIPKMRKHRIYSETSACILEVAFGKVLETDIIRYEDDYGRVHIDNEIMT